MPKNNGLKKHPRLSQAKMLTDHIVERVCRLSDALIILSSRSIKSLWDIRQSDLRIMNFLDENKLVSVREISRQVYIDQGWVSRSLNKLDKQGIIIKSIDERDSRLILISLSAYGEELLQQVRPYALGSEAFLLKNIDEKKFKAQLTKLDKNVAEMIRQVESLNLTPEKLKNIISISKN